jgi:hypothetical protein
MAYGLPNRDGYCRKAELLIVTITLASWLPDTLHLRMKPF